MNVRVGFSRAKGISGLISRVIMAFTGAKASHAWLLFYSSEMKMDVVLDAHETGFRAVPWGYFQTKNHIVELYEPKVNCDAAIPVAAEWLGTPYDYASLFGMVVVVVGRWFKRKWTNPGAAGKGKVECSESVLRGLQGAKYPAIEALDPEGVSPWDLRDFLKGDGCKLLSVAGPHGPNPGA